jgi:hypothetical protein
MKKTVYSLICKVCNNSFTANSGNQKSCNKCITTKINFINNRKGVK